MANSCLIIFPNQLFENEIVKQYHNFNISKVMLIEEPLLFTWTRERKTRPNKIKIAYMRACMKYLESKLKELRINCDYIDIGQFGNGNNNVYKFLKMYNKVIYFDVCDHILQNKLLTIFKKNSIQNIYKLDTPMFLLSIEELKEYTKSIKGNPRHSSFYTFIKNRLNVLKDVSNMDKMNRAYPDKYITTDLYYEKNYSNKKTEPKYIDGIQYSELSYFSEHLGNANKVRIYPITTEDAKHHLNNFINDSLSMFGKYQDVIIEDNSFIKHSILSPMLNIGILTPKYVLNTILTKRDNIPLNSLEGIIRQLIGWREYMRYLYVFHYEDMIKSNVFDNIVRLPKQFYKGTTGLLPFDKEYSKAIEYGYSHHIVRLMIFLNIFILLEITPDDIYTWFMDIVSIDAYDWVMIPNIYAMGYFTDKAMTRPYISSSNYILKMSNYKKDGIWDVKWNVMYHSFLQKKKHKALMFYKRNGNYSKNSTTK